MYPLHRCIFFVAVFGHIEIATFGESAQKMSLWAGEQKFWYHFYKSSIPQKWWNGIWFEAFTTFGWVISPFPISTDTKQWCKIGLRRCKEYQNPLVNYLDLQKGTFCMLTLQYQVTRLDWLSMGIIFTSVLAFFVHRGNVSNRTFVGPNELVKPPCMCKNWSVFSR